MSSWTVKATQGNPASKEGKEKKRREREREASLVYIVSSHSETQERERLIPLLHKCHHSVLSLTSRTRDGFQPSPSLLAESL